MCLIVFSWRPNHQHPLILLANRDEFYQRLTLPVHHWEDQPNILGGRDMKAGGGWLAVDSSGRLAAVTNFREWPVQEYPRSRGELVSQFLSQTLSAAEYLQAVRQRANQYAGFNLLLMDESGMFYYSNRTQNSRHYQQLTPGCYGLCNHLLDTPWPKLQKTKTHFQTLLNDSDADASAFIELMQDEQKADDHLLPNTGVRSDFEKLVSSPFISSRDYGTRNTSLLLFHRDGALSWTEQNYLPYGRKGESQFLQTATSHNVL